MQHAPFEMAKFSHISNRYEYFGEDIVRGLLKTLLSGIM